jgi:hypothetical protein
MKWFRQLISDDNNINERSFVGIISLFAMLLSLIVNLISDCLGHKVIVENFIFDGFMVLTIASFGISMTGKIFENIKQKKDDATQ